MVTHVLFNCHREQHLLSVVTMASDENEEGMELEAEHVYLLMKKEYRISRNNRAQWSEKIKIIMFMNYY